jgi:hypothetical protein
MIARIEFFGILGKLSQKEKISFVSGRKRSLQAVVHPSASIED